MFPELKEFLWQAERTEIPVSVLAEMAIDTPSAIAELVHIATNKDSQDASWRAAWVLTKVADANSPMLQSFAPRLISFLLQSANECSFGLLRGLLRTLTDMEYTEDEDGKFLEFCSKIFKSQVFPKAVRVNAMHVATNIVLKYPELKNEIITEFQIIGSQEEKSIAAACRIQTKRLNRFT
ncbi:MAG: hypothetical protein ACK5IQ_11445 [Bacteroidales bacterium]